MRNAISESLKTILGVMALGAVASLILAGLCHAQCRSCGPTLQGPGPVFLSPPPPGVVIGPMPAPAAPGPMGAPVRSLEKEITIKDLSTAKPAAEDAGTPKEGPREPEVPNFGLEVDKLAPEGQLRYWHNGVPVERERAFQALLDRIPQDQNHLRLTIFGTAEARQRLKVAAGPLLADPSLKDRWIVQEYAPDSWIVREYGFRVNPVEPTIYCQAPSGEVLHRSEGVLTAQQLLTVLRRADPSYDPSRDPDLTRDPEPKPDPKKPGPDGCPSGDLLARVVEFVKQNATVLLVAAIVAVLVYGKKGD